MKIVLFDPILILRNIQESEKHVNCGREVQLERFMGNDYGSHQNDIIYVSHEPLFVVISIKSLPWQKVYSFIFSTKQ